MPKEFLNLQFGALGPKILLPEDVSATGICASGLRSIYEIETTCRIYTPAIKI